MPCRELRTRASPGTGIWLGDSLKPRGEIRVIQALVAPGRAHSPLLPVKACERGTCGLCRGAFLPAVQGWLCGLAGGMSGCLPACVSGERLGGGSSREETRRKKEEKPPYPSGFACSSAFCSVAGRIGRLPSGPRPRRAARSRRACAQFPRLPLRARTPACLQHGSRHCGCRAVLPLLGTNEGMADAPFPAARATPRKISIVPDVETRSPRGRPCTSPGVSAPGCGSPLGRKDQTGCFSESRRLTSFKNRNI